MKKDLPKKHKVRNAPTHFQTRLGVDFIPRKLDDYLKTLAMTNKRSKKESLIRLIEWADSMGYKG